MVHPFNNRSLLHGIVQSENSACIYSHHRVESQIFFEVKCNDIYCATTLTKATRQNFLQI